MTISLRAFLAFVLLFCSVEHGRAEILVRWDQDQVPPRESLGVSRLVVPASRTAAVRNAAKQGYEIYLEVEAAKMTAMLPRAERLAGIVVVGATAAHAAQLERWQQAATKVRVLTVEPGAKWPHIRTNWVTKSKDVLQVTRRSAQPWIENNAALLRIARGAGHASSHVVTYAWKPITLSEIDEGPQLENYLVAIAETGSFGGTLVLPLHERFQRRLALGQPRARADWDAIRRSIDFYSWGLPDRYIPLANVGVVTSEPMRSYEAMNLLSRHNLPFAVVPPARLNAEGLSGFDVVIVADKPGAAQTDALAGFARTGGTVLLTEAPATSPWQTSVVTKTADRVTYEVGKGHVVQLTTPITNPDAFALDVRQILGRERRIIDIWNGITVIAASFQEPDGSSMLVTALNYAHQQMPVQFRVKGTFSTVQYESPEEPARLLSHQQRDGYTEFLLPALHIGGRVFLSK
jgi:hypothetical protein